MKNLDKAAHLNCYIDFRPFRNTCMLKVLNIANLNWCLDCIFNLLLYLNYISLTSNKRIILEWYQTCKRLIIKSYLNYNQISYEGVLILYFNILYSDNFICLNNDTNYFIRSPSVLYFIIQKYTKNIDVLLSSLNWNLFIWIRRSFLPVMVNSGSAFGFRSRLFFVQI